MARIETTLAKSLYFCNVKTHRRHVVAANGGVFRASKLEVKSYPDECGRSNAHKGSACETLTARIGIFICLKFIMNQTSNKLQDAQLKTIESIQEFLTDFHSVAELYERTAKALVEIIHVSNNLSDEARKIIQRMVDDHICLIDFIKLLDEKGE